MGKGVIAMKRLIQIPKAHIGFRLEGQKAMKHLSFIKRCIDELKKKGFAPEHAKVGILIHRKFHGLAKEVFPDAIVGSWPSLLKNHFFFKDVDLLIIASFPMGHISQIESVLRRKSDRIIRWKKVGNVFLKTMEFVDEEAQTMWNRKITNAFARAIFSVGDKDAVIVVFSGRRALPSEFEPTVISPEELFG